MSGLKLHIADLGEAHRHVALRVGAAGVRCGVLAGEVERPFRRARSRAQIARGKIGLRELIEHDCANMLKRRVGGRRFGETIDSLLRGLQNRPDRFRPHSRDVAQASRDVEHEAVDGAFRNVEIATGLRLRRLRCGALLLRDFRLLVGLLLRRFRRDELVRAIFAATPATTAIAANRTAKPEANVRPRFALAREAFT